MIILILLELFILKIFFFSLFYFIEITINNFFTFLFITLRVAEARVGMSLLTILVRVHGEDIILTISI
jgi:NADH:ubiquinone oxidoreductase subunit K